MTRVIVIGDNGIMYSCEKCGAAVTEPISTATVQGGPDVLIRTSDYSLCVGCAELADNK